MATYTLPATRIDYSGGTTTAVDAVSVEFVFPLDEGSYSYSILQNLGPDELPRVDLSAPLYGLRVDGVDVSTALDNDFLGFIEWDDGGTPRLTYVLDLQDETGGNTSTEYLIAIGGDALPTINTQLDLGIFEGSITDLGPVTSGAFAPGQDISVFAAPSIAVSEDDFVSGTIASEMFETGGGDDTGQRQRRQRHRVRRQRLRRAARPNGDDDLYGGNQGDRLFGGDGADDLIGGWGWDRLYGGRGIDVLQGQGGNDRLFGEGQADALYGGTGNDVLSGGTGTTCCRAGPATTGSMAGSATTTSTAARATISSSATTATTCSMAGPATTSCRATARTTSCDGGAGLDDLLRRRRARRARPAVAAMMC